MVTIEFEARPSSALYEMYEEAMHVAAADRDDWYEASKDRSVSYADTKALWERYMVSMAGREALWNAYRKVKDLEKSLI
jgi:hypothetical protein